MKAGPRSQAGFQAWSSTAAGPWFASSRTMPGIFPLLPVGVELLAPARVGPLVRAPCTTPNALSVKVTVAGYTGGTAMTTIRAPMRPLARCRAVSPCRGRWDR